MHTWHAAKWIGLQVYHLSALACLSFLGWEGLSNECKRRWQKLTGAGVRTKYSSRACSQVYFEIGSYCRGAMSHARWAIAVSAQARCTYFIIGSVEGENMGIGNKLEIGLGMHHHCRLARRDDVAGAHFETLRRMHTLLSL